MTLKNMLDRKDREAPVIGEAAIHQLINRVNEVTQNSKAMKVVELIQELNDKVIIFTEYRATQIYLQWFLQQNGISSVPFRGGFKRGKKDWMKDLFRGKVQVLIATEAGGEGINLQFCNKIINYDLPGTRCALNKESDGFTGSARNGTSIFTIWRQNIP